MAEPVIQSSAAFFFFFLKSLVPAIQQPALQALCYMDSMLLHTQVSQPFILWAVT